MWSRCRPFRPRWCGRPCNRFESNRRDIVECWSGVRGAYLNPLHPVPDACNLLDVNNPNLGMVQLDKVIAATTTWYTQMKTIEPVRILTMDDMCPKQSIRILIIPGFADRGMVSLILCPDEEKGIHYGDGEIKLRDFVLQQEGSSCHDVVQRDMRIGSLYCIGSHDVGSRQVVDGTRRTV